MTSVLNSNQSFCSNELLTSSVKSLALWVKLTETTVGRDKIYRTLQYFCRFLSFHLAQRRYSKAFIEKIVRLSISLATARKLFRVGKPLDNMKLVLEAYLKIQDPTLKALTIGKSVSLGFWLLLDSVQWLNLNKILEMEHEQAHKVQRLAAYGWMTGLLFSIFSDLYKIQNFLECNKSSTKDVPNGTIDTIFWFIKSLSLSNNNESGKLCRILLQDSLDIILPMNILAITNYNSGIIGLIGMGTSLMGMYNVWPKQTVA